MNIREEIIKNVDIVKIISQYIDLQKSGQNYKGLCPFHHDNNPSLVVNEEKKIFKCFVCGEGGSALEFVQKYEKIPMEKVYQKYAKELGIKYKEIKQKPEQLLLEDINNFYQNILKLSKLGEKGLAYLTKTRNIKDEIIDKFKLGYAPEDETLKKYLQDENKRKKYSQIEIDKLGVFNASGRDFFNGRLIIPIFSHTGNVVGFSGRTLKDDSIKYLNSRENEIFQKNKILYNLNNYEKSKAGDIVIVEGFFDVITAEQNNLKNVVATMGVALTKNHLDLLKQKQVKKIYLGFDNDNAGKMAITKNILNLLEGGFEVKILDYLEYKDIDEYFQNSSNNEKILLNNAQSYPKYLLKNNDITDTEIKIKLIKELKVVFKNMKADVDRDLQISEIARELDIEKNLLFDSTTKSQQNLRIKNPSKKNQNIKLPNNTEKILFYLIFHDYQKFVDLEKIIDSNKYVFKKYTGLYTKLKEYYKKNKEYDILDMIDEIPEYNEIENSFTESQLERFEKLQILDIIKDINNKVKNQTKMFKK